MDSRQLNLCWNGKLCSSNEPHIRVFTKRIAKIVCNQLDRDQLEDIAQEVMIRLWKWQDKIKVLSAWLQLVTKNLVIDMFIKSRWSKDFQAFDDMTEAMAIDPWSEIDLKISNDILESRLNPNDSLTIHNIREGHAINEASMRSSGPASKSASHRAIKKARVMMISYSQAIAG